MAKRIGRDYWSIEGRTYTYQGAIREVKAFYLLGLITKRELDMEMENIAYQELRAI